MDLAENLHRKFMGTYAVITIYDSREAWRRISDETYSEDEYMRHCFVEMHGDPQSPEKGIFWVVKGRDH